MRVRNVTAARKVTIQLQNLLTLPLSKSLSLREKILTILLKVEVLLPAKHIQAVLRTSQIRIRKNIKIAVSDLFFIGIKDREDLEGHTESRG